MSGRITPVKRRTGSRREPLPALLKAGPSRPADICEAARRIGVVVESMFTAATAPMHQTLPMNVELTVSLISAAVAPGWTIGDRAPVADRGCRGLCAADPVQDRLPPNEVGVGGLLILGRRNLGPLVLHRR
jgi:hypothetical protein